MSAWKLQTGGHWLRALRGCVLRLYAHGYDGIIDHYSVYLCTKGFGNVDFGTVRGAPAVVKRAATLKLRAFLREVRGL